MSRYPPLLLRTLISLWRWLTIYCPGRATIAPMAEPASTLAAGSVGSARPADLIPPFAVTYSYFPMALVDNILPRPGYHSPHGGASLDARGRLGRLGRPSRFGRHGRNPP